MWLCARSQPWKKAEGYFIPERFVAFCFPLIPAYLESANRRRANGTERRASQLAAIGVVRSVVHTSCRRRTVGGVSGRRFTKAAGVLPFVWRACSSGSFCLRGFILCFMLAVWALFEREEEL